MNVSVTPGPLAAVGYLPVGRSVGEGAESLVGGPSFNPFRLGGWALPPHYLPPLQAWSLQGWTEAQGLPQLSHPHVPTLGSGEGGEELCLVFCLHVVFGVFLVVSWIPIKLKKLLQLSGLADSVPGVESDRM